MSKVLQTVAVDAAKVLEAVKSVLPVLEKYVPAAAALGGPAAPALSAVAALAPLLASIPGGLISVEEQEGLAKRIVALNGEAFAGKEWAERSGG